MIHTCYYNVIVPFPSGTICCREVCAVLTMNRRWKREWLTCNQTAAVLSCTQRWYVGLALSVQIFQYFSLAWNAWFTQRSDVKS